MKRIVFLPVLIAAMLLCARPSVAALEATNQPATTAKPATPGVEMAQAVSTITGVAISPLLGVGAVGAWKYYQAAPAQRAKLPWYAQPWFWASALLIVGLCALKDVFGMSVPAVLKKPFDVLETVQHKVSALVAAGAFVPLVASVFTSVGAGAPSGLNTTCAGHGFLAAINPAWIFNGLAVTLCVLAFIVVFLASNAINILILLSPFPVVDAVLKLFRLLVLMTVVLTALANPWVGAAYALVIIGLAYFIAGWSLRLTHFGMVFIWDFGTRRCKRFTPEKPANWMFLGRSMDKVPIRTYGQFFRDGQDRPVFNYRPWLILPRRTLTLPVGIYAVGRGMLYSEIVRVEGGPLRSVMLLPPRYRGHEQQLAAIYGLTGVRETGLRAAFAWLKEWLGLKPMPVLIEV